MARTVRLPDLEAEAVDGGDGPVPLSEMVNSNHGLSFRVAEDRIGRHQRCRTGRASPREQGELCRQPVPLISLEPKITGHQNSDIRGSTRLTNDHSDFRVRLRKLIWPPTGIPARAQKWSICAPDCRAWEPCATSTDSAFGAKRTTLVPPGLSPSVHGLPGLLAGGNFARLPTPRDRYRCDRSLFKIVLTVI